MTLTRRALLLAGGGSTLAVACGGEPSPDTAASPSPGPGSRRLRYGKDPSQFADLRMAARDPLATVVLLHGGYWYPQYGLELMEPLARSLSELGYATWNIEYRRTGAGGGVPRTLGDVAAAVDRLAGPRLPSVLTEKVVLLGHSAGGHLAVWAASRRERTPGGEPQVELRGAISLSGVLDLTRAATDPRSSGPVVDFVGGTPAAENDSYALADPALLVPASCPIWAVHAEDDTVVSLDQSSSYVDRAKAAGGTATLVPVPGDHMSLISPEAESYAEVLDLVRKATA